MGEILDIISGVLTLLIIGFPGPTLWRWCIFSVMAKERRELGSPDGSEGIDG